MWLWYWDNDDQGEEGTRIKAQILMVMKVVVQFGESMFFVVVKMR